MMRQGSIQPHAAKLCSTLSSCALAVVLLAAPGCAAGENPVGSSSDDITSATLPAIGAYRNSDPAVSQTTANVYLKLTLHSDGSYEAERGPGVVCSHCTAHTAPEVGTFDERFDAGLGAQTYQLVPSTVPSNSNAQLPAVYVHLGKVTLYQPNVGFFSLSMSTPTSDALPSGRATLEGTLYKGDPFDLTAPWVANGTCALQVTLSSAPQTDNALGWVASYLVPGSSPQVSGQTVLRGQNGQFAGADSQDAGTVVERRYRRSLSFHQAGSGTLGWAFTDWEQVTSTAGPAGGIDSGWSTYSKCEGTTSFSAFL